MCIAYANTVQVGASGYFCARNYQVNDKNLIYLFFFSQPVKLLDLNQAQTTMTNIPKTYR